MLKREELKSKYLLLEQQHTVPLPKACSSPLFTEATAFWDAVPLRLAVIHQVANRTIMSELLKAANVLNLKGDMRLCMHLDDPMEVRYKLMSFGIPIECE